MPMPKKVEMRVAGSATRKLPRTKGTMEYFSGSATGCHMYLNTCRPVIASSP